MAYFCLIAAFKSSFVIVLLAYVDFTFVTLKSRLTVSLKIPQGIYWTRSTCLEDSLEEVMLGHNNGVVPLLRLVGNKVCHLCQCSAERMAKQIFVGNSRNSH